MSTHPEVGLVERPWTIYRCAECGTLSGYAGRCRNAFSDACRHDVRPKEAVEVVPVDCEWSEMVEHHMAERAKLERLLREAHEDGCGWRPMAEDALRILAVVHDDAPLSVGVRAQIARLLRLAREHGATP